MKKYLIITFCMFFSAAIFAQDSTFSEAGSSCESDLNGDGKTDVTTLIATAGGNKLIALLATKGGYTAHLLESGVEKSIFSCAKGNELKETKVKPGTGHQIKVNTGTYILLSQPEGAKIAYFWSGKKFEKVWVND
jgi:hypothetical protein